MPRNIPLNTNGDIIEIEDRYDEETDTTFEVEVEWTFSPVIPAYISGPPENCYPAEGGELESCVVILPDGTRINDGEGWLRKEIGDEGFDNAEERAFSSAEEYCDGW